MFAVVGLGNPGTNYAGTRHNIGFRIVKSLADAGGASSGRWQQKFGNDFLRTTIADESCLLLLPQRFMNLSGETSVPLLKYFKVSTEELIVVHDELDLAPGVIRLRRGGSAAGHRGVKDIIRHLGMDDFLRVRVGIGHPRRMAENPPIEAQAGNVEFNQGDRAHEDMDVSDWVLGRPGPKEKELLEKAVLDGANAVEILIAKGLEAAQRKYHRKQQGEQ